ncbi:MAG: hypothetical protein F6K39_13265 [Okeania sp. SIO3B3]|nr:hypothetical protein [Okeania sp. SIO3B3]
MPSDLNDLTINQKNLKKLTGIIYSEDKWNFVIDSYSVSKEIIRPSLVRGAKARENLYQAKCKQVQFRYGYIFLHTVSSVILFWILYNAGFSPEYPDPVIAVFLSLMFSGMASVLLWYPFYTFTTPSFICYIGSFFISGAAKRKCKQWVNSLQPTPLGTLIDEVYNYNKVVERFIKNVKVIDQLKAVGNPVEVKDRDKVIQAFRKIKSDLERALKTEKILRENPDFKPEEFSIDLTFLRAVKFEEKAQTYAEFVNDAIEIGMRVQEEMKNLQNWG